MKANPNHGVQVPVNNDLLSSLPSSQETNGIKDSIALFDQPSSSESPAPAPVAGGDDEVIKVSAVRKIKVTAPPPRAPARTNSNNSLEPKHQPLNHLNQQKRQKMPKKKRNVLYDEEDDEDEYLESSDEESDFEPMDVIEKSPYEGNLDAEKGEPLFQKIKILLEEEDNKKLNDEAIRIFGPSNAWCLVKANALIDKSGMVYSQEWTEGIVRGEKIGAPKELILLCLVSNRFAKQSDLLLSGLCRDFGVPAIINEALDAWNLASKYGKIKLVSRNFQFEKRRRDCYKAAIFVARAYGCCKAFNNIKNGLDTSLKKKVDICLDMMEENLPEQKKKRKSGEMVATKTEERLNSQTTDPPKKKRGRPRKHPLSASEPKAPSKLEESAMADEDDDSPFKPSSKKAKRQSASKASKKGAMAEQSDDEDDEDQMYPYNPPFRTKTKKESSAVNMNGDMVVTNSLSKLISSFESQYEEMGQVYHKMGKTLEELKTKILENRTATEEEIRTELLQEVQENLLKSFGKG